MIAGIWTRNKGTLFVLLQLYYEAQHNKPLINSHWTKIKLASMPYLKHPHKKKLQSPPVNHHHCLLFYSFCLFLFDRTAVTLMDQHEPPVGPCREAPNMGKVFFWLPKQDKVLGRPDRRAAQRKAARAGEGFQSHCPLVWLWMRAALIICKATGGIVNLSVACQRVW